jgi:hypothetical protein
VGTAALGRPSFSRQVLEFSVVKNRHSAIAHKPSPTTSRISLHRQRRVSVGRSRESRSSRIYRTAAASGTNTSADQSAHSVAKPHDIFFRYSVAGAAAVSRPEIVAAAHTRSPAHVRAGGFWRGSVQLPLLPSHSTNERGDCDHPAIHSAGMGLLYTIARGMQKPTLQRIAAVALAVSGIALVIGMFGSRISSRHNWSTGSTDSGILIRLLQYRRTQHPCPL